MSSATSAGGRLPPLDPRRLSHAYILAAPQELAVQLLDKNEELQERSWNIVSWE